MLGELHDTGNTTTLAHYLDLLAGAGLVTGIQKYAPHLVRRKASSPKLMVYNTALMTAQSFKSFNEARQDKAFWGHLVESACGAIKRFQKHRRQRDQHQQREVEEREAQGRGEAGQHAATLAGGRRRGRRCASW